MRGKKVLVTGGAGFVGRHLCFALLEQGAKVTCVIKINHVFGQKAVTSSSLVFYRVGSTRTKADDLFRFCFFSPFPNLGNRGADA